MENIVRRKECKYYKTADIPNIGESMLCTYVEGGEAIRNPDDFCSRGEKREGVVEKYSVFITSAPAF